MKQKPLDHMDRLPEEVVLHILSFLDTPDIIRFQALSHHYLALARDNTLWKTETFTHSRAEALRQRQKLLGAQDSRIAELRNAVTALPGADLTVWDVAQLRGSAQPRASSHPGTEARRQRHRAMVNWEPEYPHEDLNYYEEFVHRHGDINIGWLPLPKSRLPDTEAQSEVTGFSTLTDTQHHGSQKVVAALDEGLVCIWELPVWSTTSYDVGARLIGESKRGLLTGLAPDAAAEGRIIMTETGAVECVAVDSYLQRGFFAVQSRLHEIDLTTLQHVSTKQYPFPITALSEVRYPTPMTVGTNMTVHLHDPRDAAFATSSTSTSGELIGGSVYSHATLAQPGPLSILHHQNPATDDSSIWVAGRFTSLLNYDRRFFPRLRGTIHSGARIACLSSLPYPLILHELDLVRNPEASVSALLEARSRPGTTMMAAAEYKGKGSLELYGLPRVQPYQNRQTASASKLLSVAPHGGRIVFSDGDGNLKWVERDGFSHVRTFNINDDESSRNAQDASTYGIWSSTGSEVTGQGDIVQKILATQPFGNDNSADRLDIGQSNLLLWTGDGALGVLAFGRNNPLGQTEDWHDAAENLAESADQKAREDAERQYGREMRKALERNADEVRFVRGLGRGLMRS